MVIDTAQTFKHGLTLPVRPSDLDLQLSELALFLVIQPAAAGWPGPTSRAAGGPTGALGKWSVDCQSLSPPHPGRDQEWAAAAPHPAGAPLNVADFHRRSL